ncbi:MAG: cation diffusion facilitator family transporter, partial [Chloroflexota bacterium]|nr:cation diffusion facilitator family transporter [Chloroflexota bacterium]
VIVGGVVIVRTRWYPADPLISLFIAVLIARGAWRILRETVDILMEATPKDINVAQLVRDVIQQPGISDVHDLHIWSIAGGMKALSAHVQVDDRPLSACDDLLTDLNRMLQTTYKIGHSTIQVECAGCNPNHLYCSMDPEGGSDHDHAHPHSHEQTTDGLAMSIASTRKEK